MKKWIFFTATLVIATSSLSSSSWALGASSQVKAASSGNKNQPKERKNGRGKAFTATLTTYWAQGGGSDYWSKKGIGATGEQLKAGVTVAADPRVLPYGTVIEIAGIGKRVVQDTGSHVVARLASRKRGVNYPVIDLYFENRSDALRFAGRNEPFAEIRVVKLADPS